jgi:hypothetical protein
LEFINEFAVTKPESVLYTQKISYDSKFGNDESFGFKACAQLSGTLTNELNFPIAAYGTRLVLSDDVQLPNKVSVILKIEGLPTLVELSLSSRERVADGDEFQMMKKKFLNRKIDLLFRNTKHSQDGRSFFEGTTRKLRGGRYTFEQGLRADARIAHDGTESIIIDPVTRVRNSATLLEALEEEVKKIGLPHWSEAVQFEEEINRRFRAKGHTVRALYEEPKGDDVVRNTYRFVGFDLRRKLEETDNPRDPVNFHKKYGRRFSMDQPIVKVNARGGFVVDHIPELLEEVPSMHMLKRRGVSGDMQARSLMASSDRYFLTQELLEPLVNGHIVSRNPTIVQTKYYGPVMLTLDGDYIELKNNLDYQKVYDKRKLLKPPAFHRFHVFGTAQDSEKASRLESLLRVVSASFGVSLPAPCLHLSCPDGIDAFRTELLSIAEKERFTEDDLAVCIFNMSEDFEDVVYDSFKKESVKRLFPLQFVDPWNIDPERSDEQLKSSLANPLYLQIVAKCRGQPYGLQPGFCGVGTVFVGIDRYRDPFRKDAPLVTSIVFFDGEGSYVCSASRLSTEEIEQAAALSHNLNDCVAELRKQGKTEDISKIIFFEDTGIGTFQEQLKRDAKDCEEFAKQLGAMYALNAANRGCGLRVYKGDPLDELSAERVSSFSAITQMRDKNEILVVSTEPIIAHKKGKELGTPRPVLYTVVDYTEAWDLAELKQTVAKSAVWLCKHPWISPASTRLPVPLFFANKLSRLSSITDTPLSPDMSRAPLFL